jgi:hypothetical protein
VLHEREGTIARLLEARGERRQRRKKSQLYMDSLELEI